ncbi:MAG: carbohydrate ABC transporter permease, partial [Spirochaetaceae bacterium]|nr:carbohydrate ABC transporter permease [Spirochaetaceae bacterium]
MFPTPIQRRSVSVRLVYKISLFLVLAFWLLPLIAVISTSIRPGSDISAGNYWGLPSSFAFLQNYSEVFNPERSPML